MATELAVDLDGVCYEWSRTAMYMLRTYRGQAHLTTEATSWNYIQESIPKEDWRWLWSEGVRRGLFRYGHMVAGARVGLEELRDVGVGLTVVTHRPAHAVNDTLDWLTLYFKDIPLNGVHILTNQEPKSVANADVLLDDKLENVQEWTRSGRDAILFDRPWNHIQYHPLRANGWSDVPSVVSRLKEAA